MRGSIWHELRGKAQCVPSKLAPLLPHDFGLESEPRFQVTFRPRLQNKLCTDAVKKHVCNRLCLELARVRAMIARPLGGIWGI